MEDNRKLENEDLEKVTGGRVIFKRNNKKTVTDVVTDKSRLTDEESSFQFQGVDKGI